MTWNSNGNEKCATLLLQKKKTKITVQYKVNIRVSIFSATTSAIFLDNSIDN